MSELDAAKQFQFIGGNLALDFCNTVGGKRGKVVREHLVSPLAFVAWCYQSKLLDRDQAEAALSEATRAPSAAVALLERAIGLRESLFRIFDACILQRSPQPEDLAVLNGELSRALGRLRLTTVSDAQHFTWQWAVEGKGLDQPLGPIAHAAAMLLTDSHAKANLRGCHGDECGWLFLDSSKNHSRCWCDMRDCGNRAKIRRHRLKLKNSKRAG
jgi:predicted RNA-binding Zn ribbon-like protein